MSVIAEFTVSSDRVILGRGTDLPAEVDIEAERVVPATGEVLPYIWVRGADFAEFERVIDASPHVESLTALDDLEDCVLYKVAWDEQVESFLSGMVEMNATILEAYRRGHWLFRIRFERHDDLAAFHTYCKDRGISFTLERVYTPDENHFGRYDFGLSRSQQEALLAATERGYFEVPRKSTLSDVADALDITQQAASERIRRGTNKVLQKALLPVERDEA